jgi:Short C-terminal domain
MVSLGLGRGSCVGGASIWHWVVVLLFVPLLVFQVLFVLRTRRILQAASPSNRFWHPNFAWGSVIPSLNVLWIPLTVFSVQRTTRREPALQAVSRDPVLRYSGGLQKYGWLSTLALIFIGAFQDGVAPNASINGAISIVTSLIVAGTILAVIPYSIRLNCYIPAANPAPIPPPEKPSSEQSNDVFSMVERLGHLKDRGLLSAEEFDAKKRELLTRI